MIKHFILVGLFAALFVKGAVAQESLNVDLLYHWSDPTLPASFAHNNTYNEIWGYAADGREYAIIGSTFGTHIFDVTNPGEAEEIHTIPGAVTGTSIVHRDYHDYQGYLYAVCDEGPSTLQIIDLHGLPDEAPVVYSSNALFSRAHNIFIDEAYGKMYVCGGNYQFDVYSLADPESPELLVRCQNQVAGWSSQVGYVHDVYVRDNIAWCNAENALWVVDFTDTSNPVFLGDLSTYAESGYNHSGWLREDGAIYAMADETHGTRLKLIDTSDLTDLEVLSLFGTESHQFAIAHNLIFTGNILHVSYYHDGYQVWDTSDPLNPQRVAYYDTSTETHNLNYRGAWGVYPFLPSGIVLVSDMQEGLFVFDVNLPLNVNDTAEAELKAFPNPVRRGEGFYLQADGIDTGSARIALVSLDGSIRQLETPESSGSIVRLSVPTDLAQGLYVLRIFAGEQTLTTRVLVD